MRLHRATTITLAVAALLATAPPGRPLRAEEAAAPSDLAARVAALMPSVAEIKTVARTPQGRMFFDGSGFVIDPTGIIVTNRHVIAGASEITAILPDRPPLAARPLFISDWLDLALLKVDTAEKLPAVTLGDSDTVRVGDPVLLLGNPLGVGHSLSTGVISALNRDIGETMFDHFFQTDAALNHGNSGGPMFDMKGEVIGINTGLTSSPGNTGSIGIGYALPINDARFLIDQFLKTGVVHAGGIGVRAQRLSTQLAAAFGLAAPRGAIVTEVDPTGPAAGRIRNGDILLRVNDQDAADTRAVARLVAATTPGAQVQVQLLRGGSELTVPVTVKQITDNPMTVMATMGHAPAERMGFATPSDPGMTLAPVTEAMRAKLGLRPGQTGVVVIGVTPSGAAAQHRIGVDEVIEAVGMTPVSTPADVKKALKAISDQKRRYAPLLVLGQQGPRWVPLELEADR